MRPTLSVADVADRTGWSPRRVQRAFARWARRGWPRTERVRGVGRGGEQLRVDAAEFEATFADAISEQPVSLPPANDADDTGEASATAA